MMTSFADIHTHILPGIDDGAANMSEALNMLRTAYSDGTGAIVLTPHYRGETRDITVEQFRREYARLCEAAKSETPDLRLYLGCEIAYEADAPQKVYSGDILRFNDTECVLLEFTQAETRSRIISGVSEMIRYGFVPIVAHVERYEACRRTPGLAFELKHMGALLQVNADSVMGANGFGTKRLCRILLKERAVSFIASDAHDTKERPPLLRDCYLKIQKKYGEEYADEIFSENALTLLQNKNLD